jgi:hypothetical protein
MFVVRLEEGLGLDFAGHRTANTVTQVTQVTQTEEQMPMSELTEA